MSRTAFSAWLLGALCALAPAAPGGAGETGAAAILDTSGWWRWHYTLRLPLIKKGETLEPMRTQGNNYQARWLEQGSALPPAGWADAAFDDGSWARHPGALVAGSSKDTDPRSPFFALVCARGRFSVSDPAAAKGLKLALSYRGGAVVYLNGKELARGHLPAGAKEGLEALAEPYKEGEPKERSISAELTPALLARGVNVLAVEIHRAPYAESAVNITEKWPQTATIAFSTCGLESIRLSAPNGSLGAVAPDVARPKGFQVWTSDVAAPDFDLDWGDPNEPVRPVRIVGCRNGAFSGKVVVGSTSPLKGLKASVSDLAHAKSGGKIPASAVEIRYARPDGVEAEAATRYLAAPSRFDALEDVPPEEVPVREAKPAKGCLVSDAAAPVFGAVQPVWLTVRIPADAPAGDYAGKLTLSASGEKPLEVPVELRVNDWKLPDPGDWRTFIEVVESPETLALEYKAPLWSDEHLAHVERAAKLLGSVGNKVVYLPLICETNLGNSDSMVRWIRQADGSFKFDFTPMEKYLDAMLKHQKPAVVCMYLWESFLTHTGRMNKWEPGDTLAAQDAQKGHGVEVSVLDPATGKLEKMELPLYEDPKSKDAMRAFAQELLSRLKKRGLEKQTMLGFVSDWIPTKEAVETFKDLFPGVLWVSSSHNWPSEYGFTALGLKSNVYESSAVVDPVIGRPRGWKPDALTAHFPRMTRDDFPLTTFRLMGEMSIARQYRGLARLGGDFWPVLEDKRGRRQGRLTARYPKSAWHNLNIETSFLAPGKKGVISTARFEMLREGVQECEARTFIERALDDAASRAKLGDELAARAQAMLDERTRAVLRGTNTLIASGSYPQHAVRTDSWWNTPGVAGCWWFLSSGAQERSDRLYATAAEFAAKLGAR